MPLRLTHLAMLLVAGYFDHSVVTTADGQRLLVRGRAVKRYVEIERNEETGASTERESIQTELHVLDLATGAVTLIDSSTAAGSQALGAFLEEHQAALAERVRADYQPLYTATRRPEFATHLARLLRRPLGAQRDVIGALTLSLERHGVACASAQPGTGKTYMAAAVSYALWQRARARACFRVLISAPPHLVEKWKRELESTVPGVRATIVESVTDLDRAMADRTPGLQCLILARTTGKLDASKRPALARRLVVTAEAGRVWVPCCPACREPVTVNEATIVDTRRRCERCGEILYQARAAAPRHGHGGFRRTDDSPIAGQPQDGPPRYPLARRIKQRYTGQIGLYISDEYHKEKGGDSAAGMAAGTLAAAARRTLLLSGTISSGKASGSFYLLFRFVAAVRQEFRYADYTRWVDRYGIWQRRWKPDPNDRSRYGASSQRRIPAGAPQEKPGIMPAMIRHLLDHTAFLRLEDVATGLPPYTEDVKLIELSDQPAAPGRPEVTQARAYRRLEAELTAIVRAQLAAGGSKLLGAYLQATLTYPDACWRGETVVHPDDGRVMASAPALAEAVWYPKEVALRELATRERQRGRRVLVYVSHTERRDLTPRLRRLLEEAGLRVAVLKQSDATARQREAWLQRRSAAGIDVLLTNPGLVKTGLDLLDYSSLVFYEIDYSIFTVRQASKRSWRLGQTESVSVTFFAYAGTMQAVALGLVARKLRSALQLEGDTFDVGLAASDQADDSLLAMLARSLRSGERLDDVEQLFADLRQAEAHRHQEIAVPGAAIVDGELVDEVTAGEPLDLPAVPVGELAASLAPASAPTLVGRTGSPLRRLTVGSLADLGRLASARRRPARTAPPGQLSLFGASGDQAPAAVESQPGGQGQEVGQSELATTTQLALL